MTKIYDTLTASHLLDENLNENGLKYLTRTQLHREVTEYKDAIKYGVDSPEFVKYATEDAINTYDLYKLQSPQIAKQGLGHLAWDIEFPFQRALMHLAINGIKADKEAAKKMKEEVQHLYYQVEDKMLKLFDKGYVTSITPRGRKVSCEPEINMNSGQQIAECLKTLGVKLTEKTKKGKVSTTNKVLEKLKNEIERKLNVKMEQTSRELLEKQLKFIKLLIKFRQTSKLLNGFLIPFDSFIGADGRVRSSFHNTTCVTGRLSSSKPNIEQLPKNNSIANIRNLYIAEPGNVLIVADYSGQEVRIMAEESGDKSFKSALRDGLDLHQVTADAVGVSRNDAKCIVFGTAYGKSSYGFSKDFQCSEKEAQEFIDKFLNKYPGLRRAIEKTREQVYRYGFVKNMSRRKRRFPDFRKKNKWGKERCYRMAFNFKIQSYGADITKRAAANVIQNKFLKLVNIIHDEVVVECPKWYVKEGMECVRMCMVKALPISIPWEIDINYGTRYGRCK